jgi:uncharacterized protein (TIGR02466 family)
METLNLFSSRVHVFEVEGAAELNAALLDALVSESEHSPGILAANRGGWHSVPDIALRPEPVFRAYCQLVVHHMRETFDDWAREAKVELPPYGMKLQAWAMVMRDGDYTVLHDHGDATISGPYYLDTGDADLDRFPTSGAITFTDPRRSASRVLGVDLFPSSVTLTPPEGKLVLFPGYLQHHVHPYRGTRPRVCIANNATIVPEQTLTLPGGNAALGYTSFTRALPPVGEDV